jgi:molybdate transport system regulatory protein
LRDRACVGRAVSANVVAMARIGSLKIKTQLFCGEERAFGPGRADVLAAIEREGSISAAGRALGMSYRYTWLLVDSMNRCFRERLVETASGGTRGGGAGLTEAGRSVLAAYRALEAELHAAAEQGAAFAALSAMLRDEPVPPKD